MSYYGRGGEDTGRARDTYQSNYGPRDRSRSRDGGLNNRGGGGRGGGFHGRGPPRETETMVLTNYMPVNVIDKDGVGKNEWVQYDVTILAAFRKRKTDATGKFIQPFEFEVVPKGKHEGEKTLNLEKGSNPLSRRIMFDLCKQERKKDPTFYFVSDGSATAYAPRRLFTESFVPFHLPKKSVKANCGTYGPADSVTEEESKIPEGNIAKIFEIAVKEDCEKDHPDSDRSRNAWFLVRFTEVSSIDTSRIQYLYAKEKQDIANGERIRQAIDIMLKTALRSIGMISHGRSPRAFYFPEDNQFDMLSRNLKRMFQNDRATYAPFLGLANSSRLCENGKLFINSDVVVDFFDRDYFYSSRGERNRIPLLDANNGSARILGVRISNPHQPIMEERLRGEIFKEIKKIKFYVKYKRRSTPEFVQRMKQKGFTEKEIDRFNTKIMQNLSMRVESEKKVSIIWCADDPNEYHFDVEPRKKTDKRTDNEGEEAPHEVKRYTVAEYYAEKYGLPLKFPKMPIIYVGKKGWFPIEFLYQSFGKKFDANLPEHVSGILSHFDEFAGYECVQKIMELQNTAMNMAPLGMHFSDVMKLFNLEPCREEQALRAKVLPFPKLSYKHHEIDIRNGSWNLRDATFKRPADLNSFAVINFADECSARSFVEKQLSVSRRHGIDIPFSIDRVSELLDSLVIRAEGTSPNEIYRAFSDAITQAQDTFLFDVRNMFSLPGGFFRTYIQNPKGGIFECLIIPPPVKTMGEFGIILRENEQFVSHLIKNPNNGEQYRARIAFKMKGINVLIDPFNIKIETAGNHNKYKAFDGHVWRDVIFEAVMYRLENGGEVNANEVQGPGVPFIRERLPKIECPSVIFCCFNDHHTELYSFVKCMSHFFFGVQTQCVCLKKFSQQKHQDQFCSNIALKINTKLMNSCNNARAWSTSFKDISNQSPVSEIPWISEKLTMVMGIGFSHGFGQKANSVIAGTVCLDDGCMQFAQDVKIVSKCELIPVEVLKDLVKNLTYHFTSRRDEWPSRVIIFRDGLSDGSFDRVRRHEIPQIRKALYEVFKDHEMTERNVDWQCENVNECKGNGCIFCTPLMTYVACQTQHNIRVVPQSAPKDKRDKNVPSGTCLDHTIIDFRDSLSISTQSAPEDESTPDKLILVSDPSARNGFDFLLTPQGGLKGTSKPVYYRTLYNENAVWKPKDGITTPLDKDTLEKLVYHMSFQYGSATKATRSIPIVHYSKKLATMVTGWALYLSTGRNDVPENGGLRRVDLEELDDDEKQYQRLNRDGTAQEREKMVREDMMDLPDSVPSHMRTTLLTQFSPYKVRDGYMEHQAPFRLHLSA